MLLVCASSALFAQSTNDANNFYLRGEFDSAYAIAAPLSQQSPEDTALNLLVGRILADKEKFLEAIPYLKKTLELDADGTMRRPWALTFLGVCYYSTGQYEDAKSALEQCMAIKSNRNTLNLAHNLYLNFGLDSTFTTWTTTETPHFIFHFEPRSVISDTETFITNIEHDYDTLNKFFGATLPKKIDYYAWNSNNDAAKAGLQRLAFTRPASCVIHSGISLTQGRELTRILADYAGGGNPKPGFIDDGMTGCFDLRSGDDKLVIARAWMRSKKITDTIPIKYYWNYWWLFNNEQLSPVASAFVQRLIALGGREKFLQLIKDQTYGNAVAIYGAQLNTIIADFEKSLFVKEEKKDEKQGENKGTNMKQ